MGWALLLHPPLFVGVLLAIPLVLMLPGYTLTQATVAGVSASCAGKTLYVTVADASNGALQSQTASIPASSPPSSYTVTFGSAVSVASILNAHVAIN